MAIHNLTATIVLEKTAQKITFAVKDEDGVAIAGSSLITLTVTLYNVADEAIINTRDDLDILGVNNGQVDSSGDGSWLMVAADNPVVDATKEFEDHIALFEYTYGTSPVRDGKDEVLLRVQNLTKVT